MASAPQRVATNVNALASALNADNIAVAQPNVSPFGWTDGDAGDIRDIIGYVQAALDAATRAEAAAAAAEAASSYVSETETQFNAIMVQINQQYKDMAALYQNYMKTWEDLVKIQSDVDNKHTDIKGWYDELKILQDNVVKYAMQAVYKYNGMGEVAATREIDIDLGSCQSMTLMQPLTTVTIKDFVDAPSDPTNNTDVAHQITLLIKQGTGANKVKWGEVIKWNNSREPVLSYVKDKIDIITLLTIDSGNTWMGFYNGGWFDA